MGRESYKALIVALCCMLVACVKDKPQPPGGAAPGASRSVYVVCEGNFGNGDATLYLFDPVKDSVYGDLYKSANSQPLGDVFQSMTRIGGQFFLCINSSDKVVVTDTGSRKLIATIPIPKPRYILPISATKAYVSTLYSNKVYIINPETHAITGSIELPNLNPEGMCLYNNSAIICTWDTACHVIFKIDAGTDKIMQTIKIPGYAPQAALMDKEQMLWILAGNQAKGKPATWTRIDPSSGEILAVYNFPGNADALKPVFNNTKDTVYFIEVNYYGGISNNGIYRMGIHDASLPEQAFVPAKQYQYFWALGIDPVTGYIYAGDPKGFIQKGSVYIFRQDGVKTDSFNVGVGPGHFYFE
jgi:DNA-binding beta-propeller fold protein YncE